MKCADTRQITMSMNKQKQEENCFFIGTTGGTQSTYSTTRAHACASVHMQIRDWETLLPPVHICKKDIDRHSSLQCIGNTQYRWTTWPKALLQEENCWNVQTLIRITVTDWNKIKKCTSQESNLGLYRGRALDDLCCYMLCFYRSCTSLQN